MKKWEILKIEVEEYQALNVEGIGYKLKLKRKLFGIITVVKNVRSILPYHYSPKIGDILNG